MKKPHLLLVEDEPSLVITLSDRLKSEGYRVKSVRDGALALELATEKDFDLILLDVQLPSLDGFDVCRDLRQRGRQMPILMLTARSQVPDRVVGLKLGADDYVTKPFEMLELMARIEALLRRSRLEPEEELESFAFGEVEVDFRAAEVKRGGEKIELSAREFDLLRFFVENRGAAVTRDRLLDEVWGWDTSTQTRTVDVHVSQLRHKIEPDPANPKFLVTVRGRGYRFSA